jgi:acyl dehydratase
LFRSPVFVGDTLWCDVAVTAESTSRSGKQGRVVFSVNVSTDRSQDVITYSATRLIAAREPLAEGNDQ